MQETVLLSMPVDELQRLIIESVNTCLNNPPQRQSPKASLLTEEEAAQFLEIPLVKLQILIKKCQIPFRLKGKGHYFSKEDLIMWSKNNNTVEGQNNG